MSLSASMVLLPMVGRTARDGNSGLPPYDTGPFRVLAKCCFYRAYSTAALYIRQVPILNMINMQLHINIMDC